ncbi:MAG TPA: hypothetical protein VKV21_01540 [Solirubrobacteraceae bacterium]|nr:hypothetical protein [Solirubrobacteraceae bacterium]
MKMLVSSDAVARTAAAGSNLEAVAPNGQITDAVASGTADISHFLSAPNGDVYVVFASPVDLSNATGMFTANGCLLAQVDPATGVPACIDNTLVSINCGFPGQYTTPPIQFDSSGAIYYSGMASNGTMVLRKYSAGVITNLITNEASISQFVVTPNGSVFVSGSTTATGVSWTRLISATGGVTNLMASSSAFLAQFSDGNVYFGDSFESPTDPSKWIGNSTAEPVAPHFDTVFGGSLCSSAGTMPVGAFCSLSGAEIESAVQTSDGNEYVLTGPLSDSAAMEYYPTVRFLSTAVVSPTLEAAVGNDVALAGTNSSDQNLLTLYNPATDMETSLISPSNQIELYHLHYSAQQKQGLP